MDVSRLREVAEAAQDDQWEREWWQHHAVDYFHSGMNGSPDLLDYFTAMTPAAILALLDRLEAAESAVARVRELANQAFPGVMKTPWVDLSCDVLRAEDIHRALDGPR